jgi:hypothetical protein
MTITQQDYVAQFIRDGMPEDTAEILAAEIASGALVPGAPGDVDEQEQEQIRVTVAAIVAPPSCRRSGLFGCHLGASHDGDCLELCAIHPFTSTTADDEACELVPVPARYGHLCGPCYGRIRHQLRQTPQLISHIRSLVAPSIESARGPRVSGTPDRRLPIREQAVEDADDLFSMLVNTMIKLAADIDSLPPYAALPYRGEEAGAAGLPPFALEQRAAHAAVENLVQWHEKRELRIVTLLRPDLLRAWHDDLADYVSTLYGRYPEAPRKLRQAKPRLCPVCEELEVRAVFLAAGAEVRCTHCGWTADQTETEKYVDWTE